jgi:hypothetical protein
MNLCRLNVTKVNELFISIQFLYEKYAFVNYYYSEYNLLKSLRALTGARLRIDGSESFVLAGTSPRKASTAIALDEEWQLRQPSRLLSRQGPVSREV